MTTPLKKRALRTLSEIALLRGPDATVEYLVELAHSRRSLFQQWIDLLKSSKTAGSNRLIEGVAARADRLNNIDAERYTPSQVELSRGIGVYGMFTAEIGIGESARRFAHALRTTDIAFSTHNILDMNIDNIVEFDAGSSLMSSYDTAVIHLNADSFIHYLDRFPLAVFLGKRRIGFWHWELPVFPAPWASAFAKLDEVWVPSSYVAETIRSAGYDNVKIVPHGVLAVNIETGRARKDLNLPDSAFIFLTIFNANSYVSRKNPMGVIRAFQAAFPSSAKTDVLLVVKYHGRLFRDAQFDEMRKAAEGDKRILLIDENYSEEEVRTLQAACDVLVSLHRSEGYGLNLIESMAEGKLAIATGFSGNLEFMNAENSVLVPYSVRRVAKNEYLFGDGQWWAEPDHDFAVDAMRWAVARDERFFRLSRQARDDMRQKFSYAAVGKRIAGSLSWPDKS